MFHNAQRKLNKICRHILESGKKANKTSIVVEKFYGKNADSVHNMESILWYFLRYGKYNFNLLLRKNGWKFSAKLEKNYSCSTMCKVNIEL